MSSEFAPAALLIGVVLLLCGAGAARAEYPPLLWSVSDDTLSVPIGAVVDAGVDSEGIVYLLDSQLCTVHRIESDGQELPLLGRRGEGPGEFTHPRSLAVRPGGGCLVIPDFTAPAVCFSPDGRLCDGPDLSVIRDGFAMVEFLPTARYDGSDRLLAIAMTDDRALDPRNPDADRGSAVSVFRVSRLDTTPVILFSSREGLGESTVSVSGYRGPFMLRCWDVDATGRLIYANPDGRYAVVIGHPADGGSRVVDLPDAPTDERNLEKAAKAMGMPASELPRIGDVMWVGKDRFLVKPVAEASGPKISQGGTVELFDTSGRSYGRRELTCDFEEDRDLFFFRGGVLVIIEGGRDALMSSVGLKARSANGADWDVIRVRAYDLRVN